MPVYELIDNIVFPDVEEAEPNGLLAKGGDLSAERVLYALTKGIFPWFSEREPIYWWAPDPRFVLFPEKTKISKSLRRSCSRFTYKIDEDFKSVIENCAKVPRHGQKGTWITDSMISCYQKLNEYGYAISFEAYSDGVLAGGLYGVNLGGIFIGESMFHFKTDAGKAAFRLLVEYCIYYDIKLIDCQFHTDLLESLGGEYISRKEYSDYLTKFVKSPFVEI